MTTLNVSHATQGADAHDGRGYVASPQCGGQALHSPAKTTLRVARPKAPRVDRHGATLPPAGMAGIVLACMSVAACGHAASETLSALSHPGRSATVTDAASKHAPSSRPVYSERTEVPTGRMPVAATTVNGRQFDGRGTGGRSTLAATTANAGVHATEDAGATSDSFHITPPITSPPASASTAMAPSQDVATSPNISDTINEKSSTTQDWHVWAPVSVVSMALLAGLIAVMRRRARKNVKGGDAMTVIGWKGWHYPSMSAARAAFFGAEPAEHAQPWPIDRMVVNTEDLATKGSFRPLPATDSRYGLLRPIRPAMVDLFLDDDAFIQYVTATHVHTWEVSVDDAAPEQGADHAHDATTQFLASATDEWQPSHAEPSATPSHPLEPDMLEPPIEFSRDNQGDERQLSANDMAAAGPLVTPGGILEQEEVAHVATHVGAEHAAVEAPSTAHIAERQSDALVRDGRPNDALNPTTDLAVTPLQSLELEAEHGEADLRAATIEAPHAEAENEALAQRTSLENEAHLREQLKQEAEQREAEQARARHEELQRDVAIAEAKERLAAGFPTEALDVLSPVLRAPEASGDAWTVAGWCWWRVARDNGPDVMHALSQTVAAFHCAIAAEPARESTLSAVVIRCHLFMADLLRGDARRENLDAALHVMERHAAQGAEDGQFVVQRASALYERAVLSPAGERRSPLEMAQQSLAQLPPSELSDDTRWLQASIAMALADINTGRARDVLLGQAAAMLAHALDNAAAGAGDHWLARLIDVELLRLRQLKAAARLMYLRQLRDIYVPKLADAGSVLPLLSWVQVLREWAGMLSERPAREKLAEAEALFDRIQTLAPEDIGSVRFARAYYMRLRASHESPGAALDTLTKADELLKQAQSPALSADALSLERAEVALAQAEMLGEHEQTEALQRAIRLSDAATAAQGIHMAKAMGCGIHARLAIYAKRAPSTHEARELVALAERLIGALPGDPDALRLMARCEFVSGNAVAAARHCDAAWDAGCRDTELLRLWRASLTLTRNDLPNAENDHQWKRLNHCMRLAQSTGMATR